MTRSLNTTAVRAGIGTDPVHGAVVPPLYLTSNFTFAGYGGKRTYDYTRSGNPTRDVLGTALAELEGGAGSVVTATGMAAVALALQLVPAGGLVVAANDCYGGTWRLLDAWARAGKFRVEFVDLTVPSSEVFADLQTRGEQPALVWIETPSNPLLRITDIATIADAAHTVGALVVVDNTFLSPALQQPLAHGADIVVHSTTKYLNGHSDVVGGAVVARDIEVAEELAWWANCIGVTGAPFDSYLTLRGLRTLAPRLRAHQENAEHIVTTLQEHEEVSAVHWPGLPDHPGHDLARRQQSGFGAMVSFELRGGVPAVKAFLDDLQLFSLAESLGGVESLVAHPASMTHAAMTAAAREVAGISDALIRLSVGIEDVSDLVDDIHTGLNRATETTRPRSPGKRRATS